MPNLATVGQQIAREKETRRAAAAYRAENERRAQSVRVILLTEYGMKTEGAETALVDLLGDIRHFCDSQGLEFHVADKTAHMHYSAEVVQARTGVEQ